MRIGLYNSSGELIKVIDNVIELKLINDVYFIECKEDDVTINYKFNCKKAAIKEVHIIYE